MPKGIAETPHLYNQHLVKKYLIWQRDIRGRSPKTLYFYATRLATLVDFLASTYLADATVEQLEAWIMRPRRGGKRPANGTKNSEIGMVRSLYAYLHERGEIPTNPATGLYRPRMGTRKPKPIPKNVWRRIWFHPDITADQRVVFGLGFFCGLRRQEIVDLAPEHFNVLHQTLSGFLRKGGDEHAIPYGKMAQVFAAKHPDLIGDASTFLSPLHEMVEARLGKPRLLDWRERYVPGDFNVRKHELGADDMDPEWVTKYMQKWLRHLGEPKAFTPHALRHSCASYLLQAGLGLHIVADLLNHKTMDTTRRYAEFGQAALDTWMQQGVSEPATLLDPSEFNRYGM